MVRINFAPHSYLYPDVKFGEEVKANVGAALYTSKDNTFFDPPMRGIEECHDYGRMAINPESFYTKSNLQEVHIHLADEHNTAVSPNNGAFLLNLTLPMVNFYIVLQTLDVNNKLLTFFK